MAKYQDLYHLQALTHKDNRSKNQWTMNCSMGYN